MNQFNKAVKNAILRHGTMGTYSVQLEGVYDLESGTTTNTATNYSLKMYMKQYIANQYNFPNLIGKETGMFYIAAEGLSFVPSTNDYITFNAKTYRVQSVMKHSAEGSMILYRIIASV